MQFVSVLSAWLVYKKNMRTVLVIFAISLGLVLASAGMSDDQGHHHDRKIDHLVARTALKRGEILPLEKILAAVRPELTDEIVGIKFEMHHDVWYYEIRTVDEDGHLHYIHANAKTAKIEIMENHP